MSSVLVQGNYEISESRQHETSELNIASLLQAKKKGERQSAVSSLQLLTRC